MSKLFAVAAEVLTTIAIVIEAGAGTTVQAVSGAGNSSAASPMTCTVSALPTAKDNGAASTSTSAGR